MRDAGTSSPREKRPDVSRSNRPRNTGKPTPSRSSDPTTRPTTPALRRRIIQEVTRRRAESAR